ncbi:MAG: glycerophosphodiester phosphodiesterase [Bryobacterales bacterium]|nr:glycerophosphodiester phosphodiesterase [Bryobacterales bacterium]MBV9401402.1 glycerophosphodiester phosphodiesterase [Bryobacterales bacterium]
MPPFAQPAQTIQVHGHRGARGLRPENTLPAFEYAIAAGVDALELDMAVTKDNVIVISHDPLLHPPVCSGPKPEIAIHQLTLRELREWDCGKMQNPNFPRQQAVPGARMPTLDEVFALAPKGEFLFNIETKIFAEHPEFTPSPEDFVKLVLNEIRKHHLESRVVLQSFDFRTLIAMKKAAPEIKLSALYEGSPKDFTAIAKESGAQIISPDFHLVAAEQVRAAHAAGLEVLPWTPNTPADWDRLIAAGVDGIITDYPDELLKHLGRGGSPARH